jgi:Peptidase family M1 domain/Secretion system C-terminal sorting domain
MKTPLFSVLLTLCLGSSAYATSYPIPYDIVYHRISVTVDPTVTGGPISNGSVTTYFKTTTANVTSIGFDLNQTMAVSAVSYHGVTLAVAKYTHASNVLTITLPNIATLGTLDSVMISYSGTPIGPGSPVPSGYNSSTTNSATKKISIYTLGESFTGSTWWPCHDSLSDKIDSVDLIVTCPSAYRAAGNGLVTETISGGNRINTWKTRYRIATYMINFAVGAYTDYVYNITTGGQTLPVHNYLYTLTDNTTAFHNSVDVIQNILPVYVSLLNTNYPFLNEKYGIADCFDISSGGWGALEVQNMTFCASSNISSASILAHELSHQWFGDKLTTNDWHQIWLNEGFAEYFQYGVYPENILGSSQIPSIKSSVSTTSTTYVSNISSAQTIFASSSSTYQPYEKGAMTLSMLRQWLGTTNFYLALHDYLNAPGLAYNFTCVDSLKYYMQQYTPNDLTNFLNEWVNNKGYATYNIKYQFVTKGIYIQLTQARTASPDPGYFDMPIPIEIKNASGLDTTVVIIDRGGTLYRSTSGYTFGNNTIYFPLSQTPTVAPIFDPKNVVMATAAAPTSSATLSGLIILPIQDMQLNASNEGSDINLSWKVETNEPIQSVSIEKSLNGTDFSSINTTSEKGNSGNIYTGSYHDNYNNGLVYYRLRVLKQDGDPEYSEVKVFNGEPSDKLEISPNPAHNFVTIKTPSDFSGTTTRILIYNEAGQLVKQQDLSGQNNMLNIICGNFVPGVYQFSLINDKKQKLNGKFIKE